MADGFLAIWSDIDPAAETDYLHWMTREHAIERVSIPGFLAMRMFRALDVDARRYFILYELENAGVVGGADYLARLNQPTPWSQRIMPQLRNFSRGGGHVAAVSGKGRGGFIAPLRLDAAAMDAAEGLAGAAVKHDRIATARVLATDQAQTSIQTREKGMRTGDRSFDGLLLVEGVDAPSVRAAIDPAAVKIGGAVDRTVFTTIFALDRRML
jgi:hypothetical protein